MYEELYQYLLQHKKLPVPGIGTIVLEREPARADFPNRQVLAPVYSFRFQSAAPVPPGRFFNWLGAVLGISQMDAVVRFNDFVFELRKQVDKGHTIQWEGVGEIRKGLAGEIRFQPHIPALTAQPVPAQKVLREKAVHTVRVGEEEKTAEEMEAFLSRPEKQPSYWWAWALALGTLSLIFTGWYFSTHGLDSSTTANTKQLQPLETPASTYQLLP